MKKLIKDKQGSIVPIVVFFAIIIIWGLLWVIFDPIMSAVSDTSSDMNQIMAWAWTGSLVIVLLVDIAWLFMDAQKTRFTRGF